MKMHVYMFTLVVFIYVILMVGLQGAFSPELFVPHLTHTHRCSSTMITARPLASPLYYDKNHHYLLVRGFD